MSGVLVATATGFNDSSELTATDINSFHQLGGFQYDALWKVYIALKLARQDVSIAESFDVPRLYRAGLGLQMKARP
jgi:hypothetical protein